jgi:hypothetical protein
VTVGNCGEQIETYRKQIYTAQRDAFLCQQQVDRLLGTYAPTKLARTDSAGNDVALPAPDHACEPSNMESAAYFVGQLMESLEPMGLYIVDRLGRRMHPDGSYEAKTIIESPPVPSTVKLVPSTSEARPQCVEADHEGAG